jgi:CRISPR system Cascade subunit CasA
MSESRVSFNLLTEPWIPCRERDGSSTTLGLRKVLLRAPELIEVRDVSPLTTSALMRLLLAVVHAALRGPRTNDERAELWQRGTWPTDQLDNYFLQWNDRFDLFHPRYPFYQDGTFELDEPVTVARLALHLASGNNTTLFDHTLDDAPPAVAPAVVARWLVTHQAYSLGGGKGPTSERYGRHPNFSQAPPVGGASIFLRGRNLFETLLLNLVPYVRQHEGLAVERQDLSSRPVAPSPTRPVADQPLWEREFWPPPVTRVPDGYLDYLTWPNRCVRLHPERLRGDLVVRWIETAQGSILARDSALRDPFLAIREANGKCMPVRITADRAAWLDARAILGGARPPVLNEAADLMSRIGDAGRPPRLRLALLGMHADQAKVTLWRHVEWPLPAELLICPARLSAVETALAEAEHVAAALRASVRLMAARVLRPGGGDADPVLVTALVQRWGAEARYGAALEDPFRHLLHDLVTDPDAALVAWHHRVRAAMNAAFRQAASHAGETGRGLKAQSLSRCYLMRLAGGRATAAPVEPHHESREQEQSDHDRA